MVQTERGVRREAERVGLICVLDRMPSGPHMHDASICAALSTHAAEPRASALIILYRDKISTRVLNAGATALCCSFLSLSLVLSLGSVVAIL